MNVDVPNQGEGTLENTTVALNYDNRFSDHGYSPNPFDDDLPTIFYYPPRHSVRLLSNLGDHPSASEATGRSSGSMEQGQLQALNSNINSENELQQLNQDPDSEVGMTESNQRKRKITCSSVQTKLKNHGDTLRRIIVKDKVMEMECSLMKLLKIVGKFSKDDHAWVKISKDDHALVSELNKKFLVQEWPVEMDVDRIRTDADSVKKSIEEAKKDGSFNIREAELGQEVEKIGEAIKTLQKKREFQKQELKRDLNAQAQGISRSDLNAQGVSSSDLNARGLNAQAQGISSSRTSYEEDLCEYAEDFLKKLLGKENNNVEISNFKCLQVTCDSLPQSEFNSIDSKLRKLCGEAYEEAGLFVKEKLLLLAAIKEMREVKSVESVDESILLKWGAAFNKAEQAGYHMDFAKKQLELIACAFFGSQSRIKEKFNRLQKYVKAASDVEQMESSTDGMFASDV